MTDEPTPGGRPIDTTSDNVQGPRGFAPDRPTPVRPRRGPAGWFGRPVFLEARSPYEKLTLRRSPLWRGEGVPAGRDRPVLVIPGFFASRTGTDELVHVLSAAGWDVEVAGVGRNHGPAYDGMDACERDLERISARSDQPVTIIGHSRGGQFARILAVRHPHLIGQIVVIGTPLLVKYPPFAVVKVPAEVLDRAWRAGAFGDVFPDREDAVDADRFAPFPDGVDFVSVYSRTDGIVDWRTSIEPAAHTIEVSASHVGLMSSIAGITGIAQGLARQDRVATS